MAAVRQAESGSPVLLFDVSTGRELASIGIPEEDVFDIDVGQTKAVTASYQGTVRVYDRQNGQLSDVLRGHRPGLRAVTLSPDEKMLASAGHDRFIRLWDLARRRTTLTLEGHAAAVSRLAFSDDGQLLASADWNGNVFLWDVKDGKKLGSGFSADMKATALHVTPFEVLVGARRLVRLPTTLTHSPKERSERAGYRLEDLSVIPRDFGTLVD